MIAGRERYVIDIVGDILGIDSEELVEGICDEEKYIEILESFFEASGRNAIVIGYQLLPAPGPGYYFLPIKSKCYDFIFFFLTFRKWSLYLPTQA